MNLSLRYLADLAERTVRTFVQAYLGYWMTLGGAEYDTLFTINNLKVAVAASAVAVATALVGKGVGNPTSASVLPPPAQPPAPLPPEPGQTAEEQLAALLELARKIQPVAAPAPAPPPWGPPSQSDRPPGLLFPPPAAPPHSQQVGGRDPHSEGNL